MLRRAWILTAALIASLLLVRDARAVDGNEACCACATKTQKLALFCVQIPSSQQQAVSEDCDARGGVLLCLKEADAQAKLQMSTCEQRLAEEGIDCPAAAGAPALDRWGLAGLAALLAGLGAVAARRARA